jgi:hypothetical protein
MIKITIRQHAFLLLESCEHASALSLPHPAISSADQSMAGSL